MPPTVLKTPAAERDLFEAACYLGRRSEALAERFILAAETAFEKLAAMPGLGTPWESDLPQFSGVRYSPIKGFDKYVIFYLPREGEDGGITVLLVPHASQDLDSIFGGTG